MIIVYLCKKCNRYRFGNKWIRSPNKMWNSFETVTLIQVVKTMCPKCQEVNCER